VGNVNSYPELKEEVFDLISARWSDPDSLAALDECKRMEANPDEYKRFSTTEELFADLDSDDDEE